MANYIRQVACMPLLEKNRSQKSISRHNKYRSHIEIMALIIEAMKGGHTVQYSIMRRVGSINYVQLKKYLESLSDVGFIEPSATSEQAAFRATERGLAFLRQYYVLLGMTLDAIQKIG